MGKKPFFRATGNIGYVTNAKRDTGENKIPKKPIKTSLIHLKMPIFLQLARGKGHNLAAMLPWARLFVE